MSAVPWHNISELPPMAASITDGRPDLSAQVDQVTAWLRESLDSCDVSVLDERSVYVAYVVLALVTGFALEAAEAGRLSRGSMDAVGWVAANLAAGLAPYVPDEVRRG